MEVINCDCGESSMTHEGFCIQCGKDRRPSVCPHCSSRHYHTNGCNGDNLKQEDNEMLFMLNFIDAVEDAGETEFGYSGKDVLAMLKEKISRRMKIR